MNNSLRRILLDNAKTRVTYTGQKLSTKFQIKDKKRLRQTQSCLLQ